MHGAALIKVLLSYEHQTLPGNLHFNTPNPNNAGLKDGILKVVTEPTEFKQGIVALSNFGFGGEPASQLLLRLFFVLPYMPSHSTAWCKSSFDTVAASAKKTRSNPSQLHAISLCLKSSQL